MNLWSHFFALPAFVDWITDHKLLISFSKWVKKFGNSMTFNFGRSHDASSRQDFKMCSLVDMENRTICARCAAILFHSIECAQRGHRTFNFVNTNRPRHSTVPWNIVFFRKKKITRREYKKKKHSFCIISYFRCHLRLSWHCRYACRAAPFGTFINVLSSMKLFFFSTFFDRTHSGWNGERGSELVMYENAWVYRQPHVVFFSVAFSVFRVSFTTKWIHYMIGFEFGVCASFSANARIDLSALQCDSRRNRQKKTQWIKKKSRCKQHFACFDVNSRQGALRNASVESENALASVHSFSLVSKSSRGQIVLLIFRI